MGMRYAAMRCAALRCGQVSDSDFEVLTEYIAALKGGLRQRVLDEAKAAVDAQTDRKAKAKAAAGSADAAGAAAAAAADETVKARYKRAK